VLVFAAAEPVPRHDDAAAEEGVVVVAGGEVGTIVGAEQRTDDGAAVRVEIGGDARPVERGDAGSAFAKGSADRGEGGWVILALPAGARSAKAGHAAASFSSSARLRATPQR